MVKQASGNPGIKITSVFSEQDVGFQNYLKELGLPDIETRTAKYAQIGIEGTPTLMLVDENGIIRNIWKGMLTPKKQLEVKQKLGLTVDDWFIEETELNDLKRKEQTITVLDIRDRESLEKKHFSDAINIPADELNVRAVNEISLSDTVIVYGSFETEGEDAQETLLKEGFRKVYILNYKFQ